MKIDNGANIILEKQNIPDSIFADMENIEEIMERRMHENAKQEAESIAYALEYDRIF